MNIIKLSKFVRYELRCNNTVVIYKNGRSWGYELFGQLDKRSVEVTEDYRNINKISPLNFIIDYNNKKFWDYSSIETMKKSIQAMENAVKSTKDLDNTGISNNLKSHLRLINHFIDNTLDNRVDISNGVIKSRYVSDCCCYYEIPKEYIQYLKKSKNHPMENIDFSQFILNNSDGVIATFKKDELQFVVGGKNLDNIDTLYIEYDNQRIDFKKMYVNMLKLYDKFDYTIQLHQIKDNIGLVININDNPVALLLPVVRLRHVEDVKEEPKEEPKEDNVKDDFMKKTVNADRVKKEFLNDINNDLDIKESITLRIAQKLRDNNLHGKTFYIPLETETDNYNRFKIVNNELRHNDMNVLIDTDRLTYRDYCTIEDIICTLVQIRDLENQIPTIRNKLIDRYLEIANIDKDDSKKTFDFRVSLRKNQDIKYIYNYYETDVFTGYKEIQSKHFNLVKYIDYLNYKLESI